MFNTHVYMTTDSHAYQYLASTLQLLPANTAFQEKIKSAISCTYGGDKYHACVVLLVHDSIATTR